MPLKDKTGPAGLGPRTGRGLGSCKPEDMKALREYWPKEHVEGTTPKVTARFVKQDAM